MSDPSTWIEALEWSKSETPEKVEFFLSHFRQWRLSQSGEIPRRDKYTCDHKGRLGSKPEVIQAAIGGGTPRRSEPWFARAFFNHYDTPRNGSGAELTGSLPWHRVVDYETPLKARKGHRKYQGIGKIDLLGSGDSNECVVVELKIRPSETLFKAIVELGTYGTILRDEEVRKQLLGDFELEGGLPCKFVVLGQSGFFRRRLYAQLCEAARALAPTLGGEMAFVEMSSLSADIVREGRWLDRAALEDSRPRLAAATRLEFKLVEMWPFR